MSNNSSLFENIDALMQEGYKLEGAGNIDEAATVWHETYIKIRQSMADSHINEIRAFDDLFNGTQYVFNWVQDYGDLLEQNIGNHLISLEDALEFLRWTVDAQGSEDEHNKKSLKGQAAVCMIKAGKPEAGDGEFEKLIAQHPDFIWYPIWWADEYYFYKDSPNYNVDKAIEVLENAVQLEFDEDKDVLYERLIEAYKAKGSKDDMDRVSSLLDEWMVAYKSRAEAENERKRAALLKWESLVAPKPTPKEKIGRNDPCPCGSGKKYKKCCGKVV